MIRISRLDASSENEYRRLLAANPDALIYATPEYRDFLSAVLAGEPVYLIARSGEEAVGALPCFRCCHDGVGVVLNSLPWYGSHGGCIVSERNAQGVREALLAAYLEMGTASDVISAVLILTPFEEDRRNLYQDTLRPSAIDHRVGQITSLPSPGAGLIERLDKTVTQKTRNLIRKALKQGFRMEIRDDESTWRFLHQTHEENMAAIGGRAKPWAHFVALREKLPTDWRSLFVAYLDDKPVAALLLLYYKITVEYFTPVIKHKYRPLQPLTFLIWHAMVDAAERGCRRWNWGGTWNSQVSLHHFKAGWGARDCPYTYFINADRDAVAWMRARRQMLLAAFPCYYLYPFAQLEETNVAKPGRGS
ncbi:MAG: GNAT family N-acetyltransferase [Gammaproteobacteria bacterium]